MSKYLMLNTSGLDYQLVDIFHEIERAIADSTYTGDVTFTGDVDIEGTLNVDLSVTFGSTLAVTGGISGLSTLNIAGAGTFNDTLTVDGASTLTGAIDTGSTLTMGGHIYLQSYGIGNDNPIITFAAGAAGSATIIADIEVRGAHVDDRGNHLRLWNQDNTYYFNMYARDTAARFYTNGIMQFDSTNRMVFFSSNSYIEFKASQHIYFNAGDYFYFRDIDDSNAVRVSINSANGDLVSTGVVSADTMIIANSVNAGLDTDKFLVLDGDGNVDFRTGAEVTSDIGAAASVHTHDGDTLQLDGINSDGGAFAFSTTGAVTFSQNIYLGANGIGNNNPIITFAAGAAGGSTFAGPIFMGTNIVTYDASTLALNYGLYQDNAGNNFIGKNLYVHDAFTYYYLAVDSANNRVGIGYALPEKRLTVGYGNLRFNLVDNATALTCALAGAGAGNVDTGTHRYTVTYINDEGETIQGTWSANVVVADSGVDGQVSLTNISVSSNPTVTSRKIYRTKAGGNIHLAYLLTTIADNTTTTYTDNTADAGLGITSYRKENTTGGLVYYADAVAMQVGFYLTRLGYQALGSLTTGNSLVAIGSYAAYSLTTSSEVTAIGYQAGYTTTSSSWTAIGYASMLTILNGSNSVAVGANSLRVGPNGNYCTAVGAAALYYNNANYNTAFGYEAGRWNSTGTYGVSIGYRAGKGVSGNNHSNNVFVGANSGLAITTGSNNVFVGKDSGDSCTTGGSNILIGYNQDLPTTTTSNHLNIGGIIYGDLSGGSVYLGSGYSTNYAEFKADGELNLHGTARTTNCVIFESKELSPGSSGATETVLGNYVGYSYTINDDTVMSFPIEKLAGWDSTTDLTIMIRYYIDEAYVTNSGELQFEVAWSACTSDKTEAIDAPGASGTIDSGDWDIPATAKYLEEKTLGTISAASIASGDEIGLTLKRVALDGGANPTAEPVVVCVGVIYTKNKLGIAT